MWTLPGARRWPVGGLIETRNRGVGLRGGTAYSFPCFLGSLQPLGVLFLLGHAMSGAAVSNAAGPPTGLKYLGVTVYALGD